MRSRRTRKRYERPIPKPELVISEAPAAGPVSLEDLAPSRAKERPAYQPSEADNEVVVKTDCDSRVAEDALSDLVAVQRVAMPDVPIPYARPLETEVNPGVEDIADAVRATQDQG